MINLVFATRKKQDEIADTKIMQSITAFGNKANSWNVIAYNDNTHGLPKLFNDAIKRIDHSMPTIFVHDDVVIYDVFFIEKLNKYFQKYDILGIAGSSGDDILVDRWWGHENKYGFVNNYLNNDHLSKCSYVNFYSEQEQNKSECVDLIDGCFIAIRPQIITLFNLKFDERFEFHHYDLDFCNMARFKNLKIGVCPIFIGHDINACNIVKDLSYKESCNIYISKYKKYKNTIVKTKNEVLFLCN